VAFLILARRKTLGYKDVLPNPHLANQAAKAYTSLLAFTLMI